jgi:protein-S-isoprenylcysteine O-methyltransferase Ste14
MFVSSARYIIQRLGLLVIFGIILFTAAGRWDWPRAWAYLLVVFVVEISTLALLATKAPETLNQRGLSHPDIEFFDKLFAVFWLALVLITPVVAGLDAVRFRWSMMPFSAFYVGMVVLSVAAVLGTWAMLENEHFEQFVRIQTDRSHRVVTTGPYQWVRHPGYLAAILGAMATPPMLGTWWTFIPVGFLTLLFVGRTHLEDRTLLTKLPGYEEYSLQTQFRLVPGIW